MESCTLVALRYCLKTEQITAVWSAFPLVGKCLLRVRGGVPKGPGVYKLWKWVFSAYAEVFRGFRLPVTCRFGLLRVRGGVPRTVITIPKMPMSSPRTRRCSAAWKELHHDEYVFSAHAEVLR